MFTRYTAGVSGKRVKQSQQRDLSIEVNFDDYTKKFVTEAFISRERARQPQALLTLQELTVLRGVFGAASWRAHQMSHQ